MYMQPALMPMPLATHSHPPRLHILSPVPEVSKVSSPSTKPVPSLKDQRQESFQCLKLGPQGGAHDRIDVVVTSDDKPLSFYIHRELLCLFSPVFAKLLDPKPVVKPLKIKAHEYSNELDWRDLEEAAKEEGEVEVDVVINLPAPLDFPTIPLPAEAGDTRKEAFGAFVEWLYCGRQAVFPPPNSGTTAATLIELWVLAGRLGVPACQNECIVGIERLRRETMVIETHTLTWVYENTKDYAKGKCGLRNLLVDQCAWILDDDWIGGEDEGSENADLFSREALVDMILTMKRMFSKTMGWKPDFLYIPERRGEYWVKE